jgi:hypothetical protein
MSPISPQIRCREIGVADLDQIVGLLTEQRDLWARRVRMLRERTSPAPPGYPKYGYLLDNNGTTVGALFTLFSDVVINQEKKIRCYVSGWYVAPAFRAYAGMLVAYALRHKHVTYLNITPTKFVMPLLEAQGYARFCSGRFTAIPALSLGSDNARVVPATPEIRVDDGLQTSEVELLLRHTEYGCISLICNASDGKHPFVFHPRRKSMVPFARLVYCRDVEDFVRFAGPLGRYLVRRGFPLVVLDADGPVRGLIGKYSNDFPKYFKGPDKPRLGDMAYSTRVIFDF